MAARKPFRIGRSRRLKSATRRKRWCLLPLLEGLEHRVILSGTPSVVAPAMASLLEAEALSATARQSGLVPVELATGKTAWMQPTQAMTIGLPATISSGVSAAPSMQLGGSVPGAILGSLPVSSPFDFTASQNSVGPAGFIPQQLQIAYGLSTGGGYNNGISFAATEGDGTGQTIGIYEEGYNPAFVDTSAANYGSSALAAFDKTFGLPEPPSLTFVDHSGAPLSSSNNSGNNPDFFDYGAGIEVALDIEWAHAMAPGASIVVLCATPDSDNFFEDIPLGEATLAGLPGVSVISASYAWFLDFFGVENLEQTWDSTIIQPALAAHPNVSVFNASGDDGAGFGVTYPSASPEVVAVGGTSLFVTQSNQWSSEAGWNGGGGGFSQAFPLPSYQQADGFSGNANNQLTNPDVAADADPNTGVAVFDPFDFGSAAPWAQVGGTSLATPLWAGIAAIADQGRVVAGGKPLGSTAMLADLYSLDKLEPGDFHDVTKGNNGFNAGAGYDLVTGLGTPKANLLIPDLAAFGLASASSVVTEPPPTVVTGASFGIIASAVDSLGAIDFGFNGTATLSLASGPSGVTFTPVTVPVTEGLAVFPNISLGNKKASGYTLKVSMATLASSTASPVAVVAPQAGTSYFYPLPVSNGLGLAVAAADANASASNIITLSVSNLPYTVTQALPTIVVDNSSTLENPRRPPSSGRANRARSSTRIRAAASSRSLAPIRLGVNARDDDQWWACRRRRHPGRQRGARWRTVD